VPGVAGDAIARRALRGGLFLGVRQVLVHGANLFGIVALARMLSPAEYGSVTIALFVQSILVSVCALGLGVSLVRQQEEPTLLEERSVLGAQQLVAVLLAVALWALAPWLTRLYGRPVEEVALFRAVALTALLFPLQTVPVARLERHLRFGRLAVVEVVQAVAFNLIAVLLVWRGAGTRAVAVAVLVRALLAALLAQAVSPWPVGVALAGTRLRSLLRFGVPFQAATWVSLIKDSLTPILLGITAGAAAVGLVDWAQTIATYPTVALMILQRIYVPAFARVQDRPQELGRLVDRAIQAANAIAAPIAVVSLVLIGPVIHLGFSARWRPAQGLFYWLWCANLVVPTVTPLLGLLNALGRSRAVLALSVLWMVATWLLGAPLILWLGPVGFGIANVAVQLTSYLAITLARERVRFAVLANVAPSWACAGVVGLATLLIAHRWPPASLPHVAALGGLALSVYAVLLTCVQPDLVLRAWAALKANG
jgi:O-antigen/teichoic acid export membrane protein